MKVTIERAALLKSLGHVHRVVERRNTIPILANVLIRAEKSALSLKATDLDLEVIGAGANLGIVRASPGQLTVFVLSGVLWVKDTSSGKIGRLSPGHTFTSTPGCGFQLGTGQKEFDYPAGETNVYTDYTGKGGVSIGSTLMRGLYAVQFRSTDMIRTSDIKGDARISRRRHVCERGKRARRCRRVDSEAESGDVGGGW